MENKDKIKPMSISMPESLKRRIEEQAKKEGRSTSNYIRQILIKHA